MTGQPSGHFTEEDIRPAHMMADKDDRVAADRQFLLSRKSEWVEVGCPACDSRDAKPFDQKLGFAYVECRRCRTVYTNPRPTPALLDAFYASSQNYEYWNRHVFPASAAVRRERIFRPRAQRISDCCRRLGIRGGTVLELGSAFGLFLEEVKALDLFDRIIGLEPVPDLAATCRAKGFETIESPMEHVKDKAFADVVTAFEVIEHVFSPRQFVRLCAGFLRKSGLLALSCPNRLGFDMATLRMESNSFDHEHLNYFHPESLAMMVESCGFEVIELQTPGKLDADIVRKRALEGRIDLSGQPLLTQILFDRWDTLGAPFQEFLAANRLSGHMWILARLK